MKAGVVVVGAGIIGSSIGYQLGRHGAGPTEVDVFWVANGLSGHGFELVPTVGSMAARDASGETLPLDTDVPMSFFAADRDPIVVETKSVLA